MKLGVLIFFALLLTGGIAGYLGDYIGRKIGKKKVSILSLRPKHSAYMLTILSGIFLAALIFGVINIFAAVRINFTNFAFIEPQNEVLSSVKQSEDVIKLSENKQSLFIANAQNKTKPAVSVQKTTFTPITSLVTKTIHTKQYYNYRYKQNPIYSKNTNELIAYQGDVLVNAKISGLQSSDTAKSIMTQLLDVTNRQVQELGVKNNDNLLLSSSEIQSAIDSIQKEGDYVLQVTIAKDCMNNKPVPVHFILKEQENNISKDLADFLEKERIHGSIAKEDLTKSVQTAIDKVTPDKVETAKTLPSESYTKLVQSMPLSSPDSQVQLVIQKNKEPKKPLEVQVKTFKID